MTKTAQITIQELHPAEVNNLLADTIYSKLFPSRCAHCGNSDGFNRRIFHITGVLKKKHADEDTQNLLSHHFRQQHKIEHVFFRTNDKKFYVDSAICQSCGSTAIVFDISLDAFNYDWTQ